MEIRSLKKRLGDRERKSAGWVWGRAFRSNKVGSDPLTGRHRGLSCRKCGGSELATRMLGEDVPERGEHEQRP